MTKLAENCFNVTQFGQVHGWDLTHGQTHGREHDRAQLLTLQHGRAFSYSASLGSQGFDKPLFILEFIPKAFLFMKLRGFLLKVRPNNFISRT